MTIPMKSTIPGARLEEAIEYLESRIRSAKRGIKAQSKIHQELAKKLKIKLDMCKEVLDGCLICSDCHKPDCGGCI